MFYFNYNQLTAVLLITISINLNQAAITDYFYEIKKLFYNEQSSNDLNLDFTQKIPYEVSIADEKFINEAAKLTGVALSELDSCQQRVVLKLRTDCHKMNDEQLAKMAVHLLNCQSYVEGRQIYPCTEEMSIKDCTINMDSDTWTSYHLMSNRAKAVCYSIRQIQFRGLAEQTVNSLMEAAQNQLATLKKIKLDQDDLKNLAETSFTALSDGHESLKKQQKDIEKAQFFGQLMLENNINKLRDEKILIFETHNQLVEMTKSVKNKLDDSTNQLREQAVENKLNHKELIDDLIAIQDKTRSIFEKIEESSELLMEQNEKFRKQYEFTLKNLEEVNKTVHNLVSLVGGTREALEERLSWITTALGGTDLAVERLYLILWHSVFMLLAMLGCAFLSTNFNTRLIVATTPPLNLIIALWGKQQHFHPINLAIVTGILITIEILTSWALSSYKNKSLAIGWKRTIDKEKADSPVSTHTITSMNDVDSFVSTYSDTKFFEARINDDFNHLGSPTPPLSRNGFYNKSRSRSNTPLRLNTSLKSPCLAKTKVGTPCRLNSLPGRDYCHRHQSGDSIMG